MGYDNYYLDLVFFKRLMTEKISVSFRDACKIKIAHIVSLRDNSKTAPHPCLEILKNERFFFKTHFLEILKMSDLFTRTNKKSLISGFSRQFDFCRPPSKCFFFPEKMKSAREAIFGAFLAFFSGV